MAKVNMRAESSEYYPPRAPWYGGVFTFCARLRRDFHLDAVQLPAGFTIGQFILGFLIPGHALLSCGRRVLGGCFLGAYILSALVFIVALGYPAGDAGFALMISAHASSIVFLEGLWLRSKCRFRFRLALAGATLLVLWLAVYLPLTAFAERHWIMPLQVRGKVIIVRTYATPSHIGRGDWVLCSLREHNLGTPHGPGGAIQLHQGYAWGPVLGLPGDEVAFATNAFSVNGVEHPRLPHMPAGGKLTLNEKRWFIWPEIEGRMQGNVSEANISALMLDLSVVSRIDFGGQPFKYWFGRRQNLP